VKVAIPTVEDKLCMHFGHCDVFKVYDVNDNSEVQAITELVPPPHEPGVIPKWMNKNCVTTVIAGGMGIKAQNIFSKFGVKVITGASPELTPAELVVEFLAGTLKTGQNACDH